MWIGFFLGARSPFGLGPQVQRRGDGGLGPADRAIPIQLLFQAVQVSASTKTVAGGVGIRQCNNGSATGTSGTSLAGEQSKKISFGSARQISSEHKAHRKKCDYHMERPLYRKPLYLHLDPLCPSSPPLTPHQHRTRFTIDKRRSVGVNPGTHKGTTSATGRRRRGSGKPARSPCKPWSRS